MKSNNQSIFVVRRVRRVVWGVAFASYLPWIYASKWLFTRPSFGQSIGTGILGVMATAFVLALSFSVLESLVRLLSNDDEVRNLARGRGLPRN